MLFTRPCLHRILAVAITLTASISNSQQKAVAPIADEKFTPPANAAVEKLITHKKLAGAVTLVAQGGKIRHLQPHGVRSLKTKAPMTTDTIFRIHSMTKAIVSAAALQQMDRGKFELSDPVAKFIPSFSKHPEMKVEDLFRHTSGLAYGFLLPDPGVAKQYNSPKLWGGDLEAFANEAANLPLMHDPGKSWTYGISTDILGRLVEIWSGKPLDETLQTEFFEPLGMKSTGFWIDSPDKKTRFASPHQSTPRGIAIGKDPLGQKYLEKPKLISGGGGLVSTARDYWKFLQMIVDGGKRSGRVFLKPESVKLMSSDRLPGSIPNIFFGNEQRHGVGFGLGFSVVTGDTADWDEDAKPGEYGWGGAASCHYWVSPKDDNLIVITLEQTVPYNWNLERTLKPVVYQAVKSSSR